MAISKCFFLPKLKILADFQFGIFLQSLVLTQATTYNRNLYVP